MPTSEGDSLSVLKSRLQGGVLKACEAGVLLMAVELAGDLVQADAVADGPAVGAGGGEAAGKPALYEGLHLLL